MKRKKLTTYDYLACKGKRQLSNLFVHNKEEAAAAEEAGIKISLSGLDSIPYFSFDYNNAKELQTYFNQEMLKKGFLASGGTATTFAYTDQIIDDYLNSVTEVFEKINNLDFNVKKYLVGPIKHSTFARLTG